MSGVRAIVGGLDYVVGGWAKYNVEKREAQFNATKQGGLRAKKKLKERYDKRTEISQRDVVASIISSDILKSAVDLLVKRVQKMHEVGLDGADSYVKVAPVSLEHLQEIAANADTSDKLNQLAAAIYDLAVSLKVADQLHQIIMPNIEFNPRVVKTNNDLAVIGLEKSAIEIAEEIEKMHAKIASQINIIITALDNPAVKGGNSSSVPLTRLREVIKVSKELPDFSKIINITDINRSSPDLSPITTINYSFDIIDGKVYLTTPHNGLFGYIIIKVENPFLNIDDLYLAYKSVFMHEYAAIILLLGNMYYIVSIAKDAPFLTEEDINHRINKADFTHSDKMTGSEIAEFCIKYNLEVFENIINLTYFSKYVKAANEIVIHRYVKQKIGERTKERQKIMNILNNFTIKEFNLIDWTILDNLLLKTFKTSYSEQIYLIYLDIKADIFKIQYIKNFPKSVALTTTHTYMSQFGIFIHTHPYHRFKGEFYEPPSFTDLYNSLVKSQYITWNIVIASEGLYMFRPTKIIVKRFIADPDGTANDLEQMYSLECNKVLSQCIDNFIKMVLEMGFIMFFRKGIHVETIDVANSQPYKNSIIRADFKRSYKIAEKLTEEDLLNFDWYNSIVYIVHRSACFISWLTVDFDENNDLRATGHGDEITDIEDTSQYPVDEHGPFLLFYFSEGMPFHISYRLIELAKSGIESWVWLIFIDDTYVTFLKIVDDEPVIYGPRKHGAK